jgi:hypothetical protein
METHEQIIQRLKANSKKLEELVDKVKLLSGNMEIPELNKLKDQIDEEQNRIMDALWKLKEEANKKLP